MSKSSILIVEDERHIARFVQVSLERAEYRITIAENGYEALLQLSRQQFDLLVIDAFLPDISGNELAQQINDHWQKTTPPILLMIGKSPAVDFHFGTWFGIPHHFITKPFTSDELLTFVRRMLELTKEHQQ